MYMHVCLEQAIGRSMSETEVVEMAVNPIYEAWESLAGRACALSSCALAGAAVQAAAGILAPAKDPLGRERLRA